MYVKNWYGANGHDPTGHNETKPPTPGKYWNSAHREEPMGKSFWAKKTATLMMIKFLTSGVSLNIREF